jgi:hypothetical protein
VAKAKALELLALSRYGLMAELSPTGAIQSAGMLDQLLTPGRILLPLALL